MVTVGILPNGLNVYGPQRALTHCALYSILEVKILEVMSDRYYIESFYNEIIRNNNNNNNNNNNKKKKILLIIGAT